MTREVRIEQHLRARVLRLGGICRKWVCPGYRGAPDRIVILPGKRIYFVELKRPKGGRLSANQKYFHKQLSDLGFEVVVLNTKDKVNTWILGRKNEVTGYGSSLGGML